MRINFCRVDGNKNSTENSLFENILHLFSKSKAAFTVMQLFVVKGSLHILD